MSKYDLFKKYFIYFINLILFIALIIYSLKFAPVLLKNLSKMNLVYFFIALFIQFIILLLTTVKWKILLKKFNEKVNLKKLFYVFNAANIYKYVPPKGLNYVMRASFLEKEALHGKITTIFAEFYTEIFVSAVAAVLLIFFFVSFSKLSLLFVCVAMFLLLLGMLKPKIVVYFLDLFRLKLLKLRKLIENFSVLTKSKYYYIGLVLAIFVGSLHGLSFYFLNLSFGFYYIGFFVGLILFYSAHFLALLSFSPAGIGVRDISLVGLLVLYGYSRPDAVILSLMYRVVIFIAELFSGLFSLYFLKK